MIDFLVISTYIMGFMAAYLVIIANIRIEKRDRYYLYITGAIVSLFWPALLAYLVICEVIDLIKN